MYMPPFSPIPFGVPQLRATRSDLAQEMGTNHIGAARVIALGGGSLFVCLNCGRTNRFQIMCAVGHYPLEMVPAGGGSL